MSDAKALRAIADQMEDHENYRTDEMGIEALCLRNAADRIEQLTNERDKAARLGKSGGYKATPEHSWAEWCDELYRDLNKTNERIEQLEAALRRIVAMTPDPEFGAFPIDSAIDVARAALEGKD